MKNNELNHIAEIWKKGGEPAQNQKVYSKEEIRKIKMKNSSDFSKSIHHSIVFDFIQKGILILGMILLSWYFRADYHTLFILGILISFTALFVFSEQRIKNRLKTIDQYGKEIREVIKAKLHFYKVHFTPLKLMLAYTNALLVWVGSMFYFYSKYGRYKMDDTTDLLVNVTLLALAFGISYLGLSWQLKNNVIELEESLSEIDEQGAKVLQEQLRRKRRNRMIMIFTSAIGLVIFVALVIKYLSQLM